MLLCPCLSLMTTTAGSELIHCSFERVNSLRADAIGTTAMDSHHHGKKKTRTRNRPRNKCNRGDEQQEKSETGSVPALKNVEGTVTPSPPPSPAAAQALPNDSAIYLIQKLLRKKLLANKKPTVPVKVDALPKVPAKVETATQLRPAPVEQPSPTQSQKCAQVNKLLRCMGNKLQKGEVAVPSGNPSDNQRYFV